MIGFLSCASVLDLYQPACALFVVELLAEKRPKIEEEVVMSNRNEVWQCMSFERANNSSLLGFNTMMDSKMRKVRVIGLSKPREDPSLHIKWKWNSGRCIDSSPLVLKNW